MGKDIRMDITSRGMALRIVLVFLVGTLIGSLAPESGNIWAYRIGLPYVEGHFFNPLFLAIGVIGVVLACAVGFRKGK